PLPLEAVLRWAGHLARGPVPPHSLETLLGAYFDVDVRVIPFMLTWSALDKDRLAHLGERGRLGLDFIVGSHVSTCQYRFRLRLGPMDWKLFRDLLPIGAGFHALIAMIELVAGAEQTFEVELVLRAEEAPPLRLAADARDDGPRLGWSTWLSSHGAL